MLNPSYFIGRPIYISVSGLGDRIESILKKALEEGRSSLLENEALEVASEAGIPLPRYVFIKDEGDLDKVDFPPPYALKIVSPQVIHKTDVGGVMLNITRDELPQRIREMEKRVLEKIPDAEIHGYIVMEMLSKGVETIVGLTRDPQFGPVVAFGLGGIFVEIYRDVSFRLAPLEKEDALEMIREVKAYKILSGYRGLPPADLDSIADVIMKVGMLGVKYPLISEIDINPLIAYPDKAVAVDVRIILVG